MLASLDPLRGVAAEPGRRCVVAPTDRQGARNDQHRRDDGASKMSSKVSSWMSVKQLGESVIMQFAVPAFASAMDAMKTDGRPSTVVSVFTVRFSVD